MMLYWDMYVYVSEILCEGFKGGLIEFFLKRST